MDISFKTMFKNEVTAEIVIKNDQVVLANILDNNEFRAILITPPYDMEYIDGLIQMRCFERENAAADFFLKHLGLTYYNPWDIVRKTHGFWLGDCKWLLFEGEDLTWERVRYDNELRYT